MNKKLLPTAFIIILLTLFTLTAFNDVNADITNSTNETNNSLNLTLNLTGTNQSNETNTTIDTNSTNTTNQTQNQTINYDQDSDGYNSTIYNGTDCDDAAYPVNPGRPEILNNSIDDDCNPQTQDAISFDIILSKNQYAIAEPVSYTIMGINRSNLTIRLITPNNYFSYNLDYINASFPLTETIPQTYKIGLHTIIANLTFREPATNNTYRLTNSKTFEILNSITAIINSPNTINIEDTAYMNITGTGGYGSLIYTWDFGDGSMQKNGSATSHKYNQSGEYTISVIAKDQKNNTNTFTKDIRIKGAYALGFIIKDRQKLEPINDVSIIIDSSVQKTNTNGNTTFILREGQIDYEIRKEGYQSLIGNLNLNKNMTHNLTMQPIDSSTPIITLNQKEIMHDQDIAQVTFRVEDTSPVNCTLYTSEDANWWSQKQTIQNIMSNAENNITLTNLTLDSYFYKIECIDIYAKQSYSEEGTIKKQANNEEQAVNQETDTYYYVINAISRTLENYETLSIDQKEILESLDAKNKLKELERYVTNYERDADSIKNGICPGIYCKLSQTEIDKKINALKQRIENQLSKTPASVEIISSEEYIKYPKLDEIESALTLYYGAKRIIKQKTELERLSKETLKLQNLIDIKAKSSLVEITYFDLDTQKLLIVQKTLNGNYTNPKLKIIEHMPEEEGSGGMTVSTNQNNQLINNTLYEYDASNTQTIVYSLSSKSNLAQSSKTFSTILIDPSLDPKNKIVGFATLDRLTDTTNLSFLILGILISAIIIRITFSIAPGLNPMNHLDFGTKRKTRKIISLVNDAARHAENGEFEKAELIYKEIKLIYSIEKEEVRKKSYDNIIELIKKLDDTYVKILIREWEAALISKNYKKSLALYEKIKIVYESLDDSIKQANFDLIEPISQKMIELNSKGELYA